MNKDLPDYSWYLVVIWYDCKQGLTLGDNRLRVQSPPENWVYGFDCITAKTA